VTVWGTGGPEFKSRRSDQHLARFGVERLQIRWKIPVSRFVLLERIRRRGPPGSRSARLVPWRPVLANKIGRELTGVVRDEDTSWQFGRDRTLDIRV